MKVLRNKKGFTMIELMIVAIIVAILAVVLIPLMSGNKARAYATEAEAALGTVRTALRVIYAESSPHAFPVLALGPVEGRVDGISAGDLLGTFFAGPSFTIRSDATTYEIRCTWATATTAPRTAEVQAYTTAWTELDETGTFTRNGY